MGPQGRIGLLVGSKRREIELCCHKMSFGELPQEKGYLNEGESLRIPLGNENACDNEPGVDPEGIRLSQRLEVKTCPVCGARCFSDMDICYNCLHSFAHDKAGNKGSFSKPKWAV